MVSSETRHHRLETVGRGSVSRKLGEIIATPPSAVLSESNDERLVRAVSEYDVFGSFLHRIDIDKALKSRA